MTTSAKPDPQLVDSFKHEAALVAIERVRSGTVLGLGTGSTSAHFLRLLGERIRDGRLTGIAGVPTSQGSALLAAEFGIPMTTLEEHPIVDLTVDGADEVDPALNMIKGGGGALLREKIVAQVTNEYVIIVDETKLSERLGANWPIPIEVFPFGWETQRVWLEELGAEVKVRLDARDEPLQTDQGNLILDCRFGPIDEASALAAMLSRRAGIAEHGLFLDMADEVIVAGREGVVAITRDR